MYKTLLKTLFLGLSMALSLPAALLSGFGRIRGVYRFFAQAHALLPGLPGDYLRAGYYRWTLKEFGDRSRIEFGSYFAHPEARVGRSVYIGSRNILGRAVIGDGCQIASGVQILSGARQHLRGEDGALSGSAQGVFETVHIGSGCWIGAGAIVMADVGENTTVGAGSVVTRSLPANCTAVGSPARVLTPKSADPV
ncbi:MAG: acyltransferase [Bryobacterales bacterium]|nr:acyltransferase [Bryobacterales bacterium]